ncbi:MAG: beta-ketoacyl synthase, partial [Oscillospiraceae bacterium]|nr:beta-ketoacyl synthase [Oscillospiraceae bacterium]
MALRMDRDLAIVGMSGRFPLADNLDAFWDNLKNGVDCVRTIPEHRRAQLDKYLRFSGWEDDALYRGEAAFLDDIEGFDYAFFGVTRREACLMDPNQRLFLQVAYEALEDAGCT